MKIKENSLANFVHQIDLINTINGGTAMTQIDILENEENYTILLKHPSFEVENYHLELNGEHLVVYTTLSEPYPQKFETNQMRVIIPTFIRHFSLPSTVDVEQIEALFEKGTLKILIPRKKGFGRIPQTIPIKKID